MQAAQLKCCAWGDRIDIIVPTRIQLKRTRGWRMPANTVKVDRSTRWGNPFSVRPDYPAAQAVDNYQAWLGGAAPPRGLPAAVHPPSVDEIRLHLAGKNLACWCPLGTSCHADVLLAIANAHAWRDQVECPA